MHGTTRVVILCITLSVSVKRIKGIYEPYNVTVVTHDLSTTMAWDGPKVTNATLTYTVQSRNSEKFGPWKIEKMCQNISTTICKIQMEDAEYIAMQAPIFARVRTYYSQNRIFSEWVEAAEHNPVKHGIIGAPDINNISLINNDTLVFTLLFPTTPYLVGDTDVPMRVDNEELNLVSLLEANILIMGPEGLQIDELYTPEPTNTYYVNDISLEPEAVYMAHVTSVFSGTPSPAPPSTRKFQLRDDGTISLINDVTNIYTQSHVADDEHDATQQVKDYLRVADVTASSSWSLAHTLFTCAVVVILFASVAVVKFLRVFEHRRRFHLPHWFSSVMAEYKSSAPPPPQQTESCETFDDLNPIRLSTGYRQVGRNTTQEHTTSRDSNKELTSQEPEVHEEEEDEFNVVVAYERRRSKNDVIIPATDDYVQTNYLPNFIVH